MASRDAADEEEERDSPPVFRPFSPTDPPGPIALPSTAQLLIPLPSSLSGRGLSLPPYNPMVLVYTACLSKLEWAFAVLACAPSAEKAIAALPGEHSLSYRPRLARSRV